MTRLLQLFTGPLSNMQWEAGNAQCLQQLAWTKRSACGAALRDNDHQTYHAGHGLTQELLSY